MLIDLKRSNLGNLLPLVLRWICVLISLSPLTFLHLSPCHFDYFESSQLWSDPSVTSVFTVRGICIINAIHCWPQINQVLREGDECQVPGKYSHGSLGKHWEVQGSKSWGRWLWDLDLRFLLWVWACSFPTRRVTFPPVQASFVPTSQRRLLTITLAVKCCDLGKKVLSCLAPSVRLRPALSLPRVGGCASAYSGQHWRLMGTC